MNKYEYYEPQETNRQFQRHQSKRKRIKQRNNNQFEINEGEEQITGLITQDKQKTSDSILTQTNNKKDFLQFQSSIKSQLMNSQDELQWMSSAPYINFQNADVQKSEGIELTKLEKIPFSKSDQNLELLQFNSTIKNSTIVETQQTRQQELIALQNNQTGNTGNTGHTGNSPLHSARKDSIGRYSSNTNGNFPTTTITNQSKTFTTFHRQLFTQLWQLQHQLSELNEKMQFGNKEKQAEQVNEYEQNKIEQDEQFETIRNFEIYKTANNPKSVFKKYNERRKLLDFEFNNSTFRRSLKSSQKSIKMNKI